MKCKYCQAELEEGVTLCPACGKDQQEVPAEEPVVETVEETTTPVVEVASEPERPEAAAPEFKEGIKATPGKIALAIVAGVVVLALLVVLVIGGIDGDLFKGSKENLEYTGENTPAATQDSLDGTTESAVPAGTIPPDGNPEDVTCKGSYSVSDEELEASRDTVVAVAGNQELTIAQLQVYYWECIYAFDSEWGSYASLLGLDFSQGLDTQLCETGDISMTWQQYFLDYALQTWHQHQAMAQAGKDAGYVLTAEHQEELDSIQGQMEEMAVYYGYPDVDSWIKDYIGPGCTAEDYLKYLNVYYHGYGYLEHLEQNTTCTAEDVEAFFLENEGAYADGGITKDAGKVADVRHILLMPENGTTGDDGYPVYAEEDWAACLEKAQGIYDKWLEGDRSEESFHDFAVEYSEDGNASQGGIYEDVPQGYMVEAFDSWCFDDARQVGDHGLVKTEYGYHIMFFVGGSELWYATAEADLLSDLISAKIPEAMERYPMTVDYSVIKLGQLSLISG